MALAACGQGQLLVYCACSAPEFTRRAVAGRCGVLDETRRRRTIERGFRTRNLERAGGRRPSVCVCVPVRRQASGVSQSLALPLTALVGSLAPRLPKAGQRHGPGGRRGLVRAGSTVPACWWPACHWPANLSGNAARRRDRRDTLSAATTVKSLDRPHPCQPKIFEMAGRSRSGCGWVIKGSRGGVVDEEEGQPLAGLRRRKGGRVSGRESPRAARR